MFDKYCIQTPEPSDPASEGYSAPRKVFVRLTGLRPKEYQQRFTEYSGKPGSL